MMTGKAVWYDVLSCIDLYNTVIDAVFSMYIFRSLNVFIAQSLYFRDVMLPYLMFLYKN